MNYLKLNFVLSFKRIFISGLKSFGNNRIFNKLYRSTDYCSISRKYFVT